MSLGEKLRQARLAAGLSQRALCGDTITRNMLSQIENGSAQPSMATLRILAGRLDKPLSYFLEEAPALPQQTPLLEAVAKLEEARLLRKAGKTAEALTALSQAEGVLQEAPDWVLRQALLLRAQLQPDKAVSLVDFLPNLDDELLLRAQAALEAGDPQRCKAWLLAAEARTPRWQLLMGQALLLEKDHAQAAQALHQAEAQFPHRTSQLLEICYRELEDYQKAYFYACRVRNLAGK